MSIFDKERATAPGVLDSDALGTSKPVSAHALRELVRTGNNLRDTDATILNASWTIPATEDRFVPPAEWGLLYWWPYVPVRPIHTQAEFRLGVSTGVGAALSFRLETPTSDSGEIVAAATGSIERLTGTLPLKVDRPSTGTQLQLWVRSVPTTEASSSAVGTPTSWQSPTTQTLLGANAQQLELSAPSWDAAELARGTYFIEATDNATGSLLFKIRIAGVWPTPLGGTSRALVLGEPLSQLAAGRLFGTGRTIDYRILGADSSFGLSSLLVRGVPT